MLDKSQAIRHELRTKSTLQKGSNLAWSNLRGSGTISLALAEDAARFEQAMLDQLRAGAWSSRSLAVSVAGVGGLWGRKRPC